MKEVKEERKVTTIKLFKDTKLRLEKLRENKGESYDDILRKILYILNLAREDPEKAKKALERIEHIKRKNFIEQEKIKEELKKNAPLGL